MRYTERMASYYPPSSYPTEPPSRIKPPGWSWGIGITVTGQLKGGYNFGSQHREVLGPIFDSEDLPSFGRNSSAERDFFSEVEDLRVNLYDRVGKATFLTGEQRVSLRELLDRIADLQASIDEIYSKWERYPCFPGMADSAICSWSLDRGDRPADWRAVCGQPHEPRQVFEGYDPATGTNRTFTCPPEAGAGPLAPNQRPKDRAKIAEIAVGMLYHLRACQYLLTRILLYKRALREFREDEMFAGGLTSEPPVPPPDPLPGSEFGLTGDKGDDVLPPGDFLPDPPAKPGQVVGDPFSPPQPPDEPFELPDPDDLPPVGEDEPVADGGIPKALVRLDKEDLLKYGGIGLGALVGTYVLYKVLS